MDKLARDIFFYWINERHRIYLKKEAGEPKPWSDDPLFQEWKFCNVFRILDKQTQLLLHNIVEPHVADYEDVLLFNIFQFRAFNLWPTYDHLGYTNNWDPEIAASMLYSYVSEENRKLTSGAYMIRGREGMPKYESIVKTLTDVWEAKGDMITAIDETPTLEGAYRAITSQGFWGWGPFTSYQVALDLTYTPILPNPEDINTWCEFGPGAMRGIRCIYPGLRESDMLSAARGLLLDSSKFLEPHVPPLTLQDIEFSLCELQKYMRLRSGGKSKERYAGYS